MSNINAYLHVRTAKNPVYSPDGSSLSFITDYTGLPQAWEIKSSNSWPSQISFTDERIIFLQYITGTKKRIIGMDEGVNERTQLFLLNEDGTLKPLTDSPDHIHTYGGSSPDGEWIAWASNRRHPAYFDLYIQNINSLEIRNIFTGEGNYNVLKWHPDGKKLLIEKSFSGLDNILGILDLETGKTDWITERSGEAKYTAPQFSEDGNNLYVLTNKGEEFLGLAAINLIEKTLKWLDKRNWDLEDLAMSPDKKILAYTVNEGGISKGTLFSLEEEKTETWETPQGVITELAFSPDSRKIAYVLNGASTPSDIWELNLDTMKTVRLTYVSQTPAVEEKLIEPELIKYTSFDGLEVPAFYYRPKNHYKGKLPVVVFVHGGPESQIRSVYNPFLQYFLSEGYAVCTPNVRGSTGYGKTYTHLDDVRKRMDSVKDLNALADWLVQEGDADPQKLAIIGRSYGGFMVLASITHYPEIWSAAIDIVGISSFKTFLENTGPWRRKLREAEYGSIESDGDFFDDIDPLHRTADIKCPLLVLHGANDPRVPVEETEQIVAELEERNHPVSYIRFEDEGHFFVKLKNNITAYTASAEFLNKYIKA
ncbi:alpha/beta hydrolase family protein [Evansella clarkii]|uniref:S9 family peptidase n=1 Tax=Evansella clarkii TaxID=79879 RepID=UPI00099692FB|nr:S9 family peptidase [Evansella clarkii]